MKTDAKFWPDHAQNTCRLVIIYSQSAVEHRGAAALRQSTKTEGEGRPRSSQSVRWPVSQSVSLPVGEVTAGELRRRFNTLLIHLVAADWPESSVGTLPPPAPETHLLHMYTHTPHIPPWVLLLRPQYSHLSRDEVSTARALSMRQNEPCLLNTRTPKTTTTNS